MSLRSVAALDLPLVKSPVETFPRLRRDRGCLPDLAGWAAEAAGMGMTLRRPRGGSPPRDGCGRRGFSRGGGPGCAAPGARPSALAPFAARRGYGCAATWLPRGGIVGGRLVAGPAPSAGAGGDEREAASVTRAGGAHPAVSVAGAAARWRAVGRAAVRIEAEVGRIVAEPVAGVLGAWRAIGRARCCRWWWRWRRR